MSSFFSLYSRRRNWPQPFLYDPIGAHQRWKMMFVLASFGSTQMVSRSLKMIVSLSMSLMTTPRLALNCPTFYCLPVEVRRVEFVDDDLGARVVFVDASEADLEDAQEFRAVVDDRAGLG